MFEKKKNILYRPEIKHQWRFLLTLPLPINIFLKPTSALKFHSALKYIFVTTMLSLFVLLSHIDSALKVCFLPTFFSHNCSATCSD